MRQELKELYGTIEEAKADISGLWALQYLMDAGMLDKKQEEAMYTDNLKDVPVDIEPRRLAAE